MFDRIGQGIYWDNFWRLVDGCTPISPGCEHCWSAKYTHRFDGEIMADWLTRSDQKFNGKIRLRHDHLDLPLRKKKPRVWFILNDLFHKQVPTQFIDRALEIMAATPQHIYLLLTKRANLIEEKIYGTKVPGHSIRELGGGDYIPNVWLGVTVCNQEEADRKILDLTKIPGFKKFLSIEPMLGPIDISLYFRQRCNSKRFCGSCDIGVGHEAIQWVVLGGESGPGARPMNPEWVRSVRDQCQEAGVPFYFKQWGEWAPSDRYVRKDEHGHYWASPLGIPRFSIRIGKKRAGRLLDGREWNELPICK